MTNTKYLRFWVYYTDFTQSSETLVKDFANRNAAERFAIKVAGYIRDTRES